MNTRYHELRPRELVARRSAMPVAYVGLGILEWHGMHNPLGLDGVKADALAVHIASILGGIVMPPLFWGDNRSRICELVFDPAISPWLPKGTTDQTYPIASRMGIPRSCMNENAERCEKTGGWRLWKELIVGMLFQIQAFGFKGAVLLPGHYPLFAPLEDAIRGYRAEGGTLCLLTLTDRMYAQDGKSGDHGAAFETSVLLALRPDLVDIGELDSDPAVPPVGILGEDPRTAATPEFGWQIAAKMVEIVDRWIKDVKFEPGFA